MCGHYYPLAESYMAYKYTLSNRSMMIIEEFNTEPNSY